MHLLKINSVYVLLGLLFSFSCKANGPLSPEEAFGSLKNAYIKSDAGAIESLLSLRSRKKIKTISKIFSSMNENQLKALGKKFNADIKILKNLSIKDYLSIQLAQGNGSGDILKEIAENKIAGVDIKNDIAVVRIENGMELFFVKEGYWKFDMEELSSKNYTSDKH